ncbi:MAG: T9SS type A sorting domain-containing protein [Prolixibacteraceae bacterium]|nr:T9SS type A sorting domain-containing protein [Prolixibacteraceae bacterium]
MSKFAFIFIVLLFISGGIFSQDLSRNEYSTNVISRIFEGNTTKDIHEINTWNNFLYVASSDSDLYTLDVWDLSNITNPVKKSSVNFGRAAGSRIPFAPLAIIPRGNVLIVQSAAGLSYFNQNIDGTLDSVKTEALAVSSAHSVLDKIHVSGSWGSVSTIDVVGAGDNSEVEKYTSLVDFTDPLNPSFVYGTARELEGDLSAQLDGIPSSFKIDYEADRLVFQKLNTVRFDEHIEAYWSDKLDNTLNADFQTKSVEGFIDELISGVNMEESMRLAIEEYTINSNLQNITIEEWIYRHENPDIDMNLLMEKYNLKMDHTFAAMVRSMISRGFQEELNAHISEILFSDIFTEFHEQLLQNIGFSGDIEEVYNSVYEIFNQTFTASDLVTYLTEVMVGPLLGDYEFMTMTLDQAIDEICNTDLAETVSGVLKVGGFALDPLGMVDWLDFLGFGVPTCYQWPESIEQVFELALFGNEANLQHDGLAWFELLRYYAYLEGASFSDWEQSMNETVDLINTNMAKDYVNKLSEAIQFYSDELGSIEASIEKYIETIPVQGVLEDALTLSICHEFEKIGIYPQMTIEEVFEELKVEMSYDVELLAYVPDASLEEVLLAMKNLEYSGQAYGFDMQNQHLKSQKNEILNPLLDTDIAAYFNRSTAATVVLGDHLMTVMKDYSLSTFGSVYHFENIREAIENSIFTQMDIGSLLSEPLGNMLGSIVSFQGDGGSFPSFIYDIPRAYRGDCVASWKLLFRAVEISTSVVPPTNLYAAALDLAFTTSVDYAIDAFARSMLSTFVSQIFSASENHWPSWTVRFEPETIIDEPLTSPDYEHMTGACVWEDKLARLYFNRTTDFTNRKVASLVVTNVTDGSTKTYELGVWNNLDYIYADGEMLYISGNLYQNMEGIQEKANAIILNEKDDQIRYQYVYESDFTGSLLTAAQGFKVTGGGQYMLVQGTTEILILPNTFGLMNEVDFTEITSVNEVQAKLQLFPNPANQYLFVNGVEEGTVLSIFNTRGELMFTNHLSDKDKKLDISPLKKGIYIIKTENGVVSKFVKK